MSESPTTTIPNGSRASDSRLATSTWAAVWPVTASSTTNRRSTPGIASISVATPNRGADTGVVIAVPTTAPDAQETRDTLARVRALGPEIERRHPGVTLAVTGHTAAQVDISERLGGALLPFGILVVGLSLVLLMLVFRSVLVPITAALGYVLSVSAAFGAVAAVFRLSLIHI